jgi:hypothetical protein
MRGISWQFEREIPSLRKRTRFSHYSVLDNYNDCIIPNSYYFFNKIAALKGQNDLMLSFRRSFSLQTTNRI